MYEEVKHVSLCLHINQNSTIRFLLESVSCFAYSQAYLPPLGSPSCEHFLYYFSIRYIWYVIHIHKYSLQKNIQLIHGLVIEPTLSLHVVLLKLSSKVPFIRSYYRLRFSLIYHWFYRRNENPDRTLSLPLKRHQN